MDLDPPIIPQPRSGDINPKYRAGKIDTVFLQQRHKFRLEIGARVVLLLLTNVPAHGGNLGPAHGKGGNPPATRTCENPVSIR